MNGESEDVPLSGLPTPEWIACEVNSGETPPRGGFDYGSNPKVPPDWTLWAKCPANLSALAEFLARGLRRFREAPDQAGYYAEHERAPGYVVRDPNPKHVWAQLLHAKHHIDSANSWLDHYGFLIGREKRPDALVWPPKALPKEEFNDWQWSEQAKVTLLEQRPRVERAIMELLTWTADKAAESQKMSDARRPIDWRKILEEHDYPSSKTSWRAFRDDFHGETIPGRRLLAFPLVELKRAGIYVPEMR